MISRHTFHAPESASFGSCFTVCHVDSRCACTMSLYANDRQRSMNTRPQLSLPGRSTSRVQGLLTPLRGRSRISDSQEQQHQQHRQYNSLHRPFPSSPPPFYWVQSVDTISEFEVSGAHGEVATKLGDFGDDNSALPIAGTLRMASCVLKPCQYKPSSVQNARVCVKRSTYSLASA